MMHMLRRIFAVLLVLAALLSCAFADDSVEPCADVTFKICRLRQLPHWT